jgi:hypothetical protein
VAPHARRDGVPKKYFTSLPGAESYELFSASCSITDRHPAHKFQNFERRAIRSQNDVSRSPRGLVAHS